MCTTHNNREYSYIFSLSFHQILCNNQLTAVWDFANSDYGKYLGTVMITKVYIYVDQDDQKEFDREDRSVLIAID